MALVPGVSEGVLVDLDVGNSAESPMALLNSQRELFHSQIEQLQKLVVAQCKLTGVNPLSQEMAAGALSIKIGKKPRDLLNPKAVNYMQSIFSVKDTIGKKETREISALCGVTVTQVREFFAGQRSRVRKFVRLSRDKATRVDASRASSNGCSLSSEQFLPVSKEASASSADNMMIREQIPVPGNAMIISIVRDGQQDTTDLKKVEEGPSCAALEELVPGIDTNDRKFLDNIFNLMRKEETFSGQVKLMEWVLQIHNSAVLVWFLTKGGLTILSTWLSQAALEEQTTVLLIIFKVLCHLPLHKALPVQMSAILQIVNRLRFYRTSDISNRARTLLSRWSKLFVRSQALKKPLINSSKDSQKEIIRKLRISEILSDESWQSKIDFPDILALTEDMENNRKSESKQALKLLPASTDGLSKKHGRSVPLPKTKERRKVLLVEQPDHKTSGRSVQLARAVPSKHSRPMSADDIQKVKMRAMFMKHKYGKADTSSSENKAPKTEDNNHAPSTSQTSNMLSASRILQLLPPLRKDEETKPSISTTNILPKKQGTLVIPNPNTTSQEQLLEKLKCCQIQWKTPPEVIIDLKWRVGTGENGKEVEVQTQRNWREKESFYSKPQDIPLNPKEPWDLEMDFDDSLTPEIPIEPSPDADSIEDSSCTPCSSGASKDQTPATTSSPPINNGNPEPDLELLAVLLKNPDLVFALTSGKGKTMTSEEMVALLDMLKKNGVGLTELMNGAADGPKEKPKEPEPTSLPSPTPPSDPAARAGWKSEFSTCRNTPVLKPHFPGSRFVSAPLPTAAPQIPSPAAVPPVVAKTQAPGLGLPQTSTTMFSVPELTVTINPTSQHHAPHNFLPELTVTVNPTSQHHAPHNFLPKRPSTPSAHQIPNSIHALQHNSVPDHILPTKQYPVTNVLIASPSVPRQESFNHNPSPMTTLPALLPISSRPQPLLAEPPKVSPKISRWPPSAASAASIGRPNSTPDLWIGRSNGFSEPWPPNAQFFANQNNYNAYPKGPLQQPSVLPGSAGDRNDILDRAELETWSPDGSPVSLSAFRAGQKFLDARRDHGQNHRPEWSGQWDPRNRDHCRPGSNRRWRDRDGDRLHRRR